jgi:hypothetical protein
VTTRKKTSEVRWTLAMAWIVWRPHDLRLNEDAHCGPRLPREDRDAIMHPQFPATADRSV